MKRLLCVIVIIFLLSGCASEKYADSGLLLRKKLLAGNGCSFSTNITADYGEEIYEFRLGCKVDAAGNVSFSVSEPETICGITGVISATGGKLTFDDKALLFDLLADGQITPVSAPWLLVHSLRSGYIKGCGKSENGSILQIDDSYNDDALQLDVWLDSNHLPVSAEILWQGKRIVSLEIEGFTIL